MASAPVDYPQPLGGCVAVDGDTLRCTGERIRLLAIDAPELPGHCRPGRDCAPGDPFASTANLREAVTGDLTIERVGEDRYGRTLARVSGAHGDLSCWQLRRGHAIYKSGWDNGLRIARTCPADLR
nr:MULTISPECIES: thermonuclease family protein [unclassified Sphingomonas]